MYIIFNHVRFLRLSRAGITPLKSKLYSVKEKYSCHFLMLTVTTVICQENEKNLSLNGYLSSMESFMFDTLSGPFINDFLLHNRLNFKAYLNDNITFAAELRNRIFTRPSVYYSLAQNVDFSLIWQHFNGEMEELRSKSILYT